MTECYIGLSVHRPWWRLV